MTKFIKLTNKIINTAYIQNILFYSNPNKYHIQMKDSMPNPFGLFIAGTGWITSGYSNSSMTICSEADPEDYKIINKWIKNIELNQDKEFNI